MIVIYWYHLGTTNALITHEYDTAIDFMDFLTGDERELSTILYKEHTYTVEAFLATNKERV